MLTSDHKGIQALILKHLTSIHDEILIHDPEYRQLSERPNELLKQIQAKLTPEDQKLLNEYDEEWIMPINRQDEVIYSQALMRGIVIGYWVALVSQGIGEIVV